MDTSMIAVGYIITGLIWGVTNAFMELGTAEDTETGKISDKN